MKNAKLTEGQIIMILFRSMDMMHEVLNNEVKFRTFNLIDHIHLEALNITPGKS